MARQERLIVKLTDTALAALDDIWDWNVERYGRLHADEYVEFLRAGAEALGDSRAAARLVPTFPAYSFITLRWGKPRSHAHIVVFEIQGDAVQILDFHHTAQNWQAGYPPETE